MLSEPAAVVRPLSAPRSPGPEPLLPTVLGLARCPRLPLLQSPEAEDITASSGKTGCPMDPAKPTHPQQLLLEALPTSPVLVPATRLPGQASEYPWTCFPSVKWDLSASHPDSWG